VVLGYVVMPEHVHLLLSEPQREKPFHRDPGIETQLCPAVARD
jgi:REP element-mobilizing transposase RayT